jgi:polyhydroxyalkanoate synthesis regulator phasin
MSDKRTTPEEPSGNRRRRRAVPTIDLTATEVPPEAAAAPEQQAAPESPVHEPPKQESPAQETPSPEPEAAPAAREQVNARDGASGFGAYFSGPALAGGISGAALTTLVLFALWLTGLVPIRYAGSTATRARVTALEMELKDLQRRPPSPATAQTVDTQAVDALTQRVTKMEGALAALPKNSAADPALAQRVADADNAMKSLGVALAALNRRSDTVAADAQQAKARAEAAEKAVTDLRSNVQDVSKNASAAVSPSELSALRDRVAALEQSAKTAHEQIAAIAGKAAAPDKAARLALTAA